MQIMKPKKTANPKIKKIETHLTNSLITNLNQVVGGKTTGNNAHIVIEGDFL